MENKTSIKQIQIGKLKLRICGVTPFLSEPMDMGMIEIYDKKKSNKVFDKDKV